MKVVIEVPMLPPSVLSPNARPHWAERYRGSQDFKKAVWACAYNANPKHEVMFEKATVAVRLVLPAHWKIPDTDNAMETMKPALDGCVLARIIPDDSPDHVRYITPFFYEVDPARAPLTIITFEEDK